MVSNDSDATVPNPNSSYHDSPTSLKAEYASPAAAETFTHSLPAASNASTEEKTMYLSALRKSVVKLQEEVNGFLTTKMEEDKALAACAGVKVDDKAEEENYGEEKVEEEV